MLIFVCIYLCVYLCVYLCPSSLVNRCGWAPFGAFSWASRLHSTQKSHIFCVAFLRYVCYHNSELMSGNLAKKTLGDGSKTGLFYTLIREHGPLEAAR